MRIDGTMDGKPNITSMIREPRASTRPPVKPMKMPKRLPRIAAKSTVAMPTESENRPPYRTRVKMSRPCRSVPRRFNAVGGLKRGPVSVA